MEASDTAITIALAGVHALIVGDDPDSLDVLEAALRYCGATVTTAATAREAVDRLGGARPDHRRDRHLVPGEDGLWMLRRLRELPRGATLPVVALTAHAGLDDRIQRAGFAAYIVKPVDPWALCAELRRIQSARRPPA